MITYDTYLSYFQSLAEQHPSLNHSSKNKCFFTGDLTEVLGAINNRNIRYPAIMLISLEGGLAGTDHDNLTDIYDAGFLIVDALRSPEDDERKKLIYKQTLEIGMDIIRRIQHLVDICDPKTKKIFNEFDIRELEKKQWGPIWDMAYGWSFEFPISAPFIHAYKPELWS